MKNREFGVSLDYRRPHLKTQNDCNSESETQNDCNSESGRRRCGWWAPEWVTAFLVDTESKQWSTLSMANLASAKDELAVSRIISIMLTTGVLYL